MGNGAGTHEKDPTIAELHDLGLSLLAALRQSGDAAFRSLGLTYAQAFLLLHVERGVVQPKDLAQALGIVGSALSALVSRQVDEGLLTRVRVSYALDGRRVEISLTASGKELCQKIHVAWQDHTPINAQDYSNDEIRVLRAVAHKVNKR